MPTLGTMGNPRGGRLWVRWLAIGVVVALVIAIFLVLLRLGPPVQF